MRCYTCSTVCDKETYSTAVNKFKRIVKVIIMDKEIGAKNNKKTRSCQDYDNEQVLSTETLHTASSFLQDLNEYCLLDIFSNKTLTLKDLCSLAETCKCFKRIAQRAFPKDLEFIITYSCDDSLLYIFKYKNNSISYKLEKDVERVLKIFGPKIKTITILEIDRTIIKEVAKYCSNGSLKKINILTRRIIETLVVNFKLIFQYLSTLTFYDTFVEFSLYPKNIKLNCGSLTELNIYNAYYWSDILANTFPQLERFTCVQNRFPQLISLYFNDIVIKFIARHKRLKKLSLSSSESFREDLAYAIRNNCKELEELYLNNEIKKNKFEFTNLLSLNKLRALDFSIQLKSDTQLVTFLKRAESLQILKMGYGIITYEILVSLSQLTNLRELRLYSCSFNSTKLKMLRQLTKLELCNVKLSISEIFDIILHLTKLEELSIFNVLDMNVFLERSYGDIVKIIEKNPNRILKIKGVITKNFKQNRQVKLIRCHKTEA